jgi:hypothetical protein
MSRPSSIVLASKPGFAFSFSQIARLLRELFQATPMAIFAAAIRQPKDR